MFGLTFFNLTVDKSGRILTIEFDREPVSTLEKNLQDWVRSQKAWTKEALEAVPAEVPAQQAAEQVQPVPAAEFGILFSDMIDVRPYLERRGEGIVDGFSTRPVPGVSSTPPVGQ